MLNISRNIRRLNLLRAAASIALVLVLMPDTTHSQTPASNYTARGIAPVSVGNISAARATAITDAQQKIVLAALADQISLEKLSSSFATLHNLFISRPDVYVQRFKILNETTLAGTHYILIEAFTENELLRRDLESIGMHGPAQQKTAAFLMVAEASAEKKYARWWATDPAERILPFNAGERMALSNLKLRPIELRHRIVDVEDDLGAKQAGKDAAENHRVGHPVARATNRHATPSAQPVRSHLRPHDARRDGFLRHLCPLARREDHPRRP